MLFLKITQRTAAVAQEATATSEQNCFLSENESKRIGFRLDLKQHGI